MQRSFLYTAEFDTEILPCLLARIKLNVHVQSPCLPANENRSSFDQKGKEQGVIYTRQSLIQRSLPCLAPEKKKVNTTFN